MLVRAGKQPPPVINYTDQEFGFVKGGPAPAGGRSEGPRPPPVGAAGRGWSGYLCQISTSPSGSLTWSRLEESQVTVLTSVSPPLVMVNWLPVKDQVKA